MSIKPEKYKYTFYTFKIHVHIDWLTVFKHPSDLERDPLFKAVIDLIVTCVHVSYVMLKCQPLIF
jgi:hypothetical protein